MRSSNGVFTSKKSDGWGVVDGGLQSEESVVGVSATFKTSWNDVVADASTFDFPEMSRIVPGLRSIDVPAGADQDARTAGSARYAPGREIAAGDVVSDLILDSTVPGWRGKGRAS